jgi:hypothetical protein
MFGPPKDVKNECNARLFIGDDFGDNRCTMRCARSPGHEGPHKETFERSHGPVSVTWHGDERDRCMHCDSIISDNWYNIECPSCGKKLWDDNNDEQNE